MMGFLILAICSKDKQRLVCDLLAPYLTYLLQICRYYKYSMTTNNRENISNVFESVDKRESFRKYSTDAQELKKQQIQLFKLPSISDIDVSLIQKKPSRISEAIKSKGGYSQAIFSPILAGLKSQSPTLKPQSPKSLQEKRVNPQPRFNSQKELSNQAIKPKQIRQEGQPQKQRPVQEGEQQQQKTQQVQQINWVSLWQYMKLILFSYQFNLLEYLKQIDEETANFVIDLLKISPGYKCIQHIYMFYLLKYGFVVGLLAALIYPLPYSILFLMITVDLDVPFVAIFMLAGMRSGAIALLLKYCFHFPKHTFHWIVLLFTIAIGIILPNNYIFILLFAISIFLSLYTHSPDTRQSTSSQQQFSREEPVSLQVSAFGFNFNAQEIYKQYRVFDKLPETYANISIMLIILSGVILWVLQRYYENRELSIFGQILPISLLMSSKQMLAFFPFIYRQTIGSSTLHSNTLISLSFLFPGPHSKAFMFFIVHTQIKNVFIGYICLYLPSILLANVFIGYRPHFFTTTYYNIRQSIQAVGNGIVFCLVFQMLSEQPCFFKSICYSAVVIMVVAKLYKLRQLFAITLGIFLISARTIVLNVNKNIPFQVQACLNTTLPQ